MSDELIAENLQLRDELAQLLEQAQQNQRILQRHQAFDLQLISAASFHELIDTLLHKFALTAALDIVSLSLFDPEYEIRRILLELNINPGEFPHLLFLQDESNRDALFDKFPRPALGNYDVRLHGTMFPKSVVPPVSVAIVPLMRHDRLIGSLNFGSHDASRFASSMGTDFIEHLASIVAICLENVINNERLKHMGLTDPLTGVNNRRYVERRLQEEIGRSRRQGTALACMYIDIDHFKQINDRAGHQGGDEVLREIAARIKTELRMSDALGRFGGEEFVVLLIDADLDNALNVADRIRQSIAGYPLCLSSGESFDVTVSIGVAALTHSQHLEPVETTAQRFVARADRALYQAKAGGRNLVVGDR
jgi:two-component system, cell cycle response regulator